MIFGTLEVDISLMFSLLVLVLTHLAKGLSLGFSRRLCLMYIMTIISQFQLHYLIIPLLIYHYFSSILRKHQVYRSYSVSCCF
jgi:ascorbate-specific PTS system EIIC-type component UlaA